MLYRYKAINEAGQTKVGEIDAVNTDLAIASLQRRGLIVLSVDGVEEKKGFLKGGKISFFDKVPLKDIVMMSRQLSTLFEAQVSAVKSINLLANNVENKFLGQTLEAVSRDIQGGITIAEAMRKHEAVFSDFYVNMISAGEETGRLNETFTFLADYLERQYELTSKTRSALVYPAFIVLTFIIVMVLMMTTVIPKLGEIIVDSGVAIPIYTKIVIGVSDFLVNYGWMLAIAIFVGFGFLAYSVRSQSNKYRIDQLKLRLPYFGNLFRKIYLSRIADNMHTMLLAGIPVVRSLEITASVVENKIFQDILINSLESVKAGNMISDSLAAYDEMPDILVQMMRVGEETGSLAQILDTLGKFYKREVDNAVDTLIGLIEPVMIIGLAVAVGILLTSVLIPIYNIAGSIS